VRRNLFARIRGAFGRGVVALCCVLSTLSPSILYGSSNATYGSLLLGKKFLHRSQSGLILLAYLVSLQRFLVYCFRFGLGAVPFSATMAIYRTHRDGDLIRPVARSKYVGNKAAGISSFSRVFALHLRFSTVNR